jgi:hypothetical protein
MCEVRRAVNWIDDPLVTGCRGLGRRRCLFANNDVVWKPLRDERTKRRFSLEIRPRNEIDTPFLLDFGSFPEIAPMDATANECGFNGRGEINGVDGQEEPGL